MTSRSRITLLSMVACPDCGLPAEILDWFSLDSTDGSIEHIVLACIDGHYFRMSADRLPADTPVQSGRAAAACQAAGSGAQPSGPALSRLPGRLGVVRTPVATGTPVVAAAATARKPPAAARAGIAAAGAPHPPGMAD